MEILVSSKWLNEHLTDLDLIILDTSGANTISGDTSKLKNTRIKGARLFDLKNKFSDKKSTFPSMLTTPEIFELECRKLGINKSSKIVVYDNIGAYWSPRVWWMFKTMGHDNIAVLDGGLIDWITKGYKIEEINTSEIYSLGNFEAHFESKMLSSFDDVFANTNQAKSLLIDARSADRFNGIIPEPRKGLRSGHIPNAINIPYENVFHQGKFKTKKVLKTIFKALEKEERPLIFSCGSGITACIVLFASELVIKNKKSIYDGSWTEWAQRVK